MDEREVSIRRAKSRSDFAMGAQLLREHIGALDVPEASSYLDVTDASLKAAYGEAGARFLLAESQGSAIGMIAYKPFGPYCAQLNYFYVQPGSRGCGAGYALMKDALETARSDGYYSAILSTLPKLSAARRLYDAFGFSRIPPAYPDLPEAEYYLRQL